MTRKNMIHALLIGTSTTIAVALTALMGVSPVQASPHSDRGCIRCHLPHNAAGDGSANPNISVPLWNPTQSVTTLTTDTYSGTTVGAKDSGPTGASVLCLSCHDGTGVSATSTRKFGAGAAMSTLAHSHPISVVYDASLVASGALKDPATTPALRFSLDGNGKLQCTGCHTPHSGEQTHRLRWVYDDANPATSLTFCNTCHNK